MSISCAIDFSAASERVATAAARLAVRLGEPLHLVCSVEQAPEAGALVGAARRLAVAARLAQLTQRLHRLDADVHAHLLDGELSAALLRVARRCSSQLIVQAGVGLAEGGAPALEEWIWRAPVPTLLVWNTTRFEEWVEDGRRLRVLLVLGVAPERRAPALHAERPPERRPPRSCAGRESLPSRPSALARRLQGTPADVVLICPPGAPLGAAASMRLGLPPAELPPPRIGLHHWRPGVS